jgi:hypothetical protein
MASSTLIWNVVEFLMWDILNWSTCKCRTKHSVTIPDCVSTNYSCSKEFPTWYMLLDYHTLC